MLKLVSPVIVGQTETLLNSKDNIFEFHDTYCSITTKYKFEKKKDPDDEFSPTETVFCDFHQVILLKFISSIHWMWDRIDKCYVIDITADGKGIAWNMPNKEETLIMYARIMDWWLKSTA
jgi:hypothetical protein